MPFFSVASRLWETISSKLCNESKLRFIAIQSRFRIIFLTNNCSHIGEVWYFIRLLLYNENKMVDRLTRGSAYVPEKILVYYYCNKNHFLLSTKNRRLKPVSLSRTWCLPLGNFIYFIVLSKKAREPFTPGVSCINPPLQKLNTL